PTVARPGIQKLLAALVVIDRSTDQEIREIDSGFAAVEGKISIRSARVPLVDLEVAKFTAELHRVGTHNFREAVLHHPRVVRLKRGKGRHADREIIEVNGRQSFREVGRPRGNNSKRAWAGDKSQIRQLGKAALRLVRDRGRAEKA